jgi:hypothetical protein
MGQDHDWGVYRWTKTGFVLLSPSEQAAAKTGYTNMTELFKREGWSEAEVLPVRKMSEQHVALGGVAFVVRSTQSDDGMSKIEIIRADKPAVIRYVYEFKDETAFVDAEGYKRVTE